MENLSRLLAALEEYFFNINSLEFDVLMISLSLVQNFLNKRKLFIDSATISLDDF